MCPFALVSKEDEQFHGLVVVRPEPVRQMGVEFGRFTGGEDEGLLTEQQPKSARDHEKPFEALMGFQFVIDAGVWRDQQFMRLDATGPAERNIGHAVAGDGTEVDARVARTGCPDKLIQRYCVHLCQRQQQLQRGFTCPTFQTGQGALTDPGSPGKVGQRHSPPVPQLPQPGPHRSQHILLFRLHNHQHAKTATFLANHWPEGQGRSCWHAARVAGRVSLMLPLQTRLDPCSMSETLPTTNASELDPRRWLALTVVSVATLMVVVDSSIINIALPKAQADRAPHRPKRGNA